MPQNCPAVASPATSAHFAVFRCGRSATPCRRMRSAMAAALRSTTPRSRISAGVGRSSILMLAARPETPARPRRLLPAAHHGLDLAGHERPQFVRLVALAEELVV